ncbi:MAG TPA: TlpA disulfide reductase family protein [Acidisarcina sp.]
MKYVGALLLSGVVGLASSARCQPEQALQAGQFVSHLTIRMDDGSRLSTSQWPAHPVLLDFWASWCSVCIDAFPRLSRLHSEYGNRLQIISINIDDLGTLPRARIVLREHPFKVPEANLGGGLANPILRRFQWVNHGSLPMYVLLGSDRMILYSGWGGQDQTELIRAVRAALPSK